MAKPRDAVDSPGGQWGQGPLGATSVTVRPTGYSMETAPQE